MTTYQFSTQCQDCKHFWDGPYLQGDVIVCTVFPEGIPEEILSMQHDHNKPFPGDSGITYVPNPRQKNTVK